MAAGQGRSRKKRKERGRKRKEEGERERERGGDGCNVTFDATGEMRERESWGLGIEEGGRTATWVGIISCILFILPEILATWQYVELKQEVKLTK